MRKIHLLLLLSSFTLYCQIKKADVKQILKMEINHYREQIKADTVLVNKEIMLFDNDMDNFRYQATHSEVPTQEISEIFGEKGENLYGKRKSGKRKWCSDYFQGQSVGLYDLKKVKRNTFNPKALNLLSITKPLLRKDKKFALVQSVSQHTGNVLMVYKYVNGKWKFYKSIQISYS